MHENFKKALSEYVLAERHFQKTRDQNGLLLCYLGLMEQNRILAKWDAVREYEKLSDELRDSFNPARATLAHFYNRKAAIASEVDHDNDQAIQLSLKAINYAMETNDTFTMASSYNQIAFGYGTQNKFQQAHHYYQRSLELYKKIGNERYVVDLYMNLSRHFQVLKQLDSSDFYAFKGYKLAEHRGFEHAQQMNCMLLFENATGRNDFRSALEYHIKYVDIGSKNEQKRWNKVLLDLEKKHQVAVKEKELASNKNQLKLKELNLQRSQTTVFVTLLSLFFIVIILALLAYFFLKQRLTNKQLNTLLEENRFLLEESNHRIKNNLQLVTSLLHRKLDGEPDERNNLKEVLEEIEAISTLHKHIYLSKDKKSVNLHNYLLDIQSNFSYMLHENRIALTCEVSPIELDINKAMYLGLLFTECLINSMKHAFADTPKPQIHLTISLTQEGAIEWVYTDNGCGLPADKNPELVRLMCKQLKSHFHLTRAPGFELTLRLNP